jgi:hypothetical protein
MNDEQKYKMYAKLTKVELVSMLVEASNMVENMIHSLEVHESDPIYKSPNGNVTNAVER